MAEIKIERKERSLLPWLLAAILLLGLLWFLFARDKNGTVASGVPRDRTTSDSVVRDTSAAAGTLAPQGTRTDSSSTVPPR